MSDASSKARPNRLARETSPYLLLHQHNPVDWYPWGAEALARARTEDKPIFLSVGYSTCYWCHVMERESFSDPATAALMNREFVNIKLDREERPELDEIYMTATQFIAEQGGWPNSVFLTPDLKPFFAGTYFPPADRYGRPGFPSVLQGLAEAWRERRDDIDAQAEEVAVAIRHHLEDRAVGGTVPSAEGAERSLQALARRFDTSHGGFGMAPKFPTPSNLSLLLEFADQDPDADRMLAATLDRMARGGIYDQLGGGFHRYATDREWKIPHFEKMLYDNGLLLEVYALQYARSGDVEAGRIARETAEWMRREMTAPEGGFWSAIDAETDGDEGAFYVFRETELQEELGIEDAQFLAPLLGFEGPPFFEGGRYVLHLPEAIAAQAERRRIKTADLWAQIDPLRARLLAARARRKRPATDDKVLAEWNGMAISGLATAGQALQEPWMVEAAIAAARFVLGTMRSADSGLQHTARAGVAKIPAFLGDYAYMIRGLLALDRVTGDRVWQSAARELFAEQQQRLGDPRGGWFTAAESNDVLFRSKDIFDGATPSAYAIAVQNALDLFRETTEESYLEIATAALSAVGPLVEHQVEAARTMTVAARRLRALAGERLPAAPALAPPVEEPLAEEARQVLRPFFDLGAADDAGWRSFKLTVKIADGFHLHADLGTADGMIATRLAGDGVELRQVLAPAGRPLALGGEVVQALRGTIEWSGELRLATATPRLLLRYQACDERRCLPAVTVGLDLSPSGEGVA
ncbi:MAG: thioredoxin domain-containing protein [Acidobacteriota bacterium]